MPKRSDIKKILVIGAGPIIIGQACEFDYSGTQAIKALKEEGYKVILINSNPATIMTDPQFSDKTYIEPITKEYVEAIIKKEKPHAILPTVGGQTALNIAMELYDNEILKKYNVELIGANKHAIETAESREKFKKAMTDIGLEVPYGYTIQSVEEGINLLNDVSLPAIIRPSFTLGGSGGSVAFNEEEFQIAVNQGIKESPVNQVLIEEYLFGWKEYELEVIRDLNDNVIIICNTQLFLFRQTERQVMVYRASDLQEVHTVPLDVSPTILVPYYDQDSNTLFVTGKVTKIAKVYKVLITCNHGQ